jgi:hypothetical protein
MQFGSDETLTNETREGGCVGLTDITPCVLASCSLTLTHIYGTMHARGFGHPGM